MAEERDLWQELLFEIKGKIKPQIFKTWFKPTRFRSLSQNKLTIEVPNDFFQEWLKNRYLGIIKKELKKITNKEMKIDFVLSRKSKNVKKKGGRSSKKSFFSSKLNSRYRFENFVVGNNNRLAHAAALAVAQSPSHVYNPLFIYGDVGLGKTHLLQAIGHCIMENKDTSSVTYLPSEQFTNELINAIRDGRTIEFRKKYRHTDVLLVDDIHFLAGKERTQEEFFHTFNALYEARKQIVLSSDRPPTEIPTLQKRVLSRFEWGLIVDIQPPDLETRIAILKKKAEMENIDLPDKVALFIAERIKTDIRKLEGCLVRLIAYSSLIKKKMDGDSIKGILKDILPQEEPKPITIGLIQKVVSKHYQIKEEVIKGKKRSKSIAFPRQVAMYLCRELTDASFPEVGEKFGGKDHTTVIYAWRKIKQQEKEDEMLADELKKIIKLLKNQV